MNGTVSDKVRHFFHVVSNIRPIVWIGLYVIEGSKNRIDSICMSQSFLVILLLPNKTQ